MARNYANLPAHEVRRKDRQKEEAWIKEYITTAPYGAIATVYDGQPFINSNLFVYDPNEHAIFIHTAHVGRTKANVEEGNSTVQACFSAFSMGRLLPAEEALEFSVEYEGVTAFGILRLVDEDGAAKHALQLLLDKYAPHLQPGRDYRATTTEELKRTAVFRLDIDSWSGKKKEAEADFPGAFLYPVVIESPS